MGPARLLVVGKGITKVTVVGVHHDAKLEARCTTRPRDGGNEACGQEAPDTRDGGQDRGLQLPWSRRARAGRKK